MGRPCRSRAGCFSISPASTPSNGTGRACGGSGGVGSITYGGLREPGNLLAARIVTLEEEPRILELRGAAAQAVNHAYGTTGIITALEMPLAPAFPWIDLIVAFDDFFEAAAFGRELARA